MNSKRRPYVWIPLNSGIKLDPSRQHLPSVFSFHFRFHKGKSNFGSIKKRTAQKRKRKVKGSRNGHIQNAFDGLKWWDTKKVILHVISRQTNVSSVWSDFDNLLYLLLPTKIAWPQMWSSVKQCPLLSWNATIFYKIACVAGSIVSLTNRLMDCCRFLLCKIQARPRPWGPCQSCWPCNV